MKRIFVLRFFLVTAICPGISSVQAQVNNDTTAPVIQNRIVQVEFDEDLLDAAGMQEFEKIELYNINNGERFSTYIIKANDD